MLSRKGKKASNFNFRSNTAHESTLFSTLLKIDIYPSLCDTLKQLSPCLQSKVRKQTVKKLIATCLPKSVFMQKKSICQWLKLLGPKDVSKAFSWPCARQLSAAWCLWFCLRMPVRSANWRSNGRKQTLAGTPSSCRVLPAWQTKRPGPLFTWASQWSKRAWRKCCMAAMSVVCRLQAGVRAAMREFLIMAWHACRLPYQRITRSLPFAGNVTKRSVSAVFATRTAWHLTKAEQNTCRAMGMKMKDAWRSQAGQILADLYSLPDLQGFH